MEDFRNILSVSITNTQGTFEIAVESIEKLYWIEDIFSFCITGKLIFNDRMNLLEFMPIVGAEQVDITYGDEDTEKSIRFSTFKIQRIEPLSVNTFQGNTIELYLVDEYFHFFHSKRYSKTFKNERYSDIVRYIMKNHIGIDDFKLFEDSRERIDYFYTGYKTPGQNIKWLMDRCSGIKSGQPGFVLYRTSQDRKHWNWITLETLLQQKKLMEPADDEGKVYSFVDQNVFYINKILSHEFQFIDLSQLQYLVGGHFFGYDSKRKKFIEKNYTIDDALKRFTVLGRYSLIPEYVTYDETSYEITGEDTERIIDNIFFSRWIKRYCTLQYIKLNVRGDTRRHAGGMIDIEWTSADDETRINKAFMNKSLVKSVVHSFNRLMNPPYKQRLILIKNGYNDSDDTTLKKAVKRNL